ncbi:NUDIX domain-containing protein [Kibdelosporangium lantanae]|uniref:NUDIX domain-containing protein n=1 Tax=Kibdelosporangium lantanae TaxID=1497396 RepID=A0ABW3M745_9PSEU
MTTEIIARAVIHRDHHLLVVRQRNATFFFLPGGHLEPGEDPATALVRELAEELGTQATVSTYLGELPYEYDDVQELNHVFTATIDTPNPVSQEPHLEFHWLPLDDLAASDLRPPALKSLIAGVLS